MQHFIPPTVWIVSSFSASKCLGHHVFDNLFERGEAHLKPVFECFADKPEGNPTCSCTLATLNQFFNHLAQSFIAGEWHRICACPIALCSSRKATAHCIIHPLLNVSFS